MKRGFSLALLLGIVLVVFLKSPSEKTEKTLPISLLPVDENCFLTQNTCARNFEKASVSLSLPRPIPVAKSFLAVLKTQNLNAQSIRLNLQGVEMAMGDLFFPFIQKEQNHFEAKTMIPLCLTGKMRWRATLLIETKEKEWRIPWDFWAGGE